MTKIFTKKSNDGIAGHKLFHTKLFLAFLLIGTLLFTGLAPKESYAANGNICTIEKDPNTGQWKPTKDFEISNKTIVTNIITNIKIKLTGITTKIYAVVILTPQYWLALQAAVTLYIVIYGILFTTGMVQITVYDLVTRLMKIGILVLLTSTSSWTFFNKYVIGIFDSFTDNTILYVTQSAGQNIPYVTNFISGISTISNLDSSVNKVISSRMFVSLMAAALTDPYGPFYFVLLLFSIFSFMRSIMTALWVYIMSLVLRTLLFGLAPVFIPTILFNRTRHIFDGWLAQVVNSCLQPILLFIFFVFFVKLMDGAVDNILQTPVCFSKTPQGWSGSGFDFAFWKFMDYKTGTWQVSTQAFKLQDPFPISMISVLSFFMIAEIANRFNSVIIQISSQIAQASTNLAGEGGPVQGVLNFANSLRFKKDK